MPAGKGTAPAIEQLQEKQRDSLPCLQEEGYGGEWMENKLWGTEEQWQSLKLVLTPFHNCFLYTVGEACRKQTLRYRARSTRGGFGSEVNCLSFLSWPITSAWLDVANYYSKKLSNSFIFAHIQTKKLSSAAIYLLAAVVTHRATYNH